MGKRTRCAFAGVATATGLAVAIAVPLTASGAPRASGAEVVTKGTEIFDINGAAVATFRFTPEVLSVPSGTTVTWKHGDTGSDPHTSHVHVSGRHGAACYSGRTCTGYDHAAEHNTTPWSLALAQGPTGGPPSGHLDEDGVLGPMTISAWQRRLGTPVDGFITQPPGHSDLVRAVQVYLNRLVHAGLAVDGQGINQDGHSAFSTTRALQRYLGTAQDGVLSLPRSQCVQALQRRLNAGTF